MSAEPGLLARTFDWIRTRAHHHHELDMLSRADLDILAADIGVSQDELRGILAEFDDHAELMDRMMRARGMDPEAVRRMFGPVFRAMEITCAQCQHVSLCRRELAAGTVAVHCHDFCGNAGVIDDLLDSTDRGEPPRILPS